MKLSSPVFNDGETIDKLYTCEGSNHNPPLQISDAPTEAQSLVLICDDPDAATDPNGPGHTFDHWVVWNIPPTTTEIAEGSVPPFAVQGLNGRGEKAYTGPCPPTGEHRYFFRLYALDSKLDLPEDADKEDVEDALSGHVLTRTELVGTYQKA
ncbi:MAG: YbhB/YbcL family Raf kinase inhibitor-like protein [Candidatus Saccharimonadales bacterium]